MTKMWDKNVSQINCALKEVNEKVIKIAEEV